MPRITIDDGPGSIQQRMYQQLRPELQEASAAMRNAVYGHTILPWRTFEGVRYRMAIANGCLVCQSLEARTQAALDAGFTESMYEEMDAGSWRESEAFSPAEKLAIDFAERFALDHESIDDDFWVRLHAQYDDAEIVDLTFVAGRFMAFGRLTHVLGLDDSCEVPSQAEDRASVAGAR